MFKKTKVRSILELLGKGLSAREISKSLSVSRNTVSEVQTLYHETGKSWEDIADWDDDRLYELFYPDNFKYKPRYALVDYSYVHSELQKISQYLPPTFIINLILHLLYSFTNDQSCLYFANQ